MLDKKFDQSRLNKSIQIFYKMLKSILTEAKCIVILKIYNKQELSFFICFINLK